MTIPSWAVPGAKVVCVKEGAWELWRGPGHLGQCPMFGQVCTITHVDQNVGGVWLRLRGFGANAHYYIDNFRPVVADDIEATLFRSKRQPVSREVEQA